MRVWCCVRLSKLGLCSVCSMCALSIIDGEEGCGGVSELVLFICLMVV